MKFTFLKEKMWIAGLITSAIGILLFKIVARLFTKPVYEITVFLVGVTLGIAGMTIIAIGVSRKYNSSTK